MRILRNIFGIVLFTYIFVVSALSLAEYFGQYDHSCELLGHLKLVWVALLAVGVFISLLFRSKTAILLSLTALVIAVVPVVALYIPDQSMSPSGKKIRFLQMNLWGGKNHDHKRAIDLIRKENPDIFGLSEVTSAWMPDLRLEFKDYPYIIAEPAHGGIALFSRIPMKGEVRYFDSKIRRPRIYCKLQLPQEITLVFAHPVIPPVLYDVRNGELEVLAQEAKTDSAPAIIAGDMNCTPWSYYFRKMLSTAGLRDSERSFGPQPSWNEFTHIPVFPIDHCLVSPQFAVLNRRTLAPIGSDHLPVVVDLQLRSEQVNSGSQ